MEHQTISNLMNKANDVRFVTRKQNIINDQSNTKSKSYIMLILQIPIILNIWSMKLKWQDT